MLTQNEMHDAHVRGVGINVQLVVDFLRDPDVFKSTHPNAQTQAERSECRFKSFFPEGMF